MKGIIYYTDNRLDDPMFKGVQNQLLKSGLPIVSCSLKPLNFGKNIVVEAEPGPVTMVKQILAALEASETEYIFFCEHDILYHPSHFNFMPPGKDIFYYNTNAWKWDYRGDKVITHDNLRGLFALCVSREKALEHYRLRMKIIEEREFDKIPGKNPSWARRMGYEPGKPKRLGGISDGDIMVEWKSEYPNINIRHSKTMTPIKMTLESYIHKPTGWKESTIDKLPGWNIEEFLNLRA